MHPLTPFADFWKADLNWFGVLGIILSILIAWIVLVIQKREKRLYWSIENRALVVNAKRTLPNLRIHYAGHGDDVDTISIARIAIWNAGRDAIVPSDIPKTEPLIVTTQEGVRILGSAVLLMTSVAIKAACRYSKQTNSVSPSFEFLDYQEGMVLQIAHTGQSADALVVSGQVIGFGPVRRIARKRLIAATPRHFFVRLVLPVLMLVIPVLLAASFLISEPKQVYTFDGKDYVEVTPGSAITEVEGRRVTRMPVVIVITICALAAANVVYFGWKTGGRWRIVMLPSKLWESRSRDKLRLTDTAPTTNLGSADVRESDAKARDDGNATN